MREIFRLSNVSEWERRVLMAWARVGEAGAVAELGVSRQRVRQVFRRTMVKIRKRMGVRD